MSSLNSSDWNQQKTAADSYSKNTIEQVDQLIEVIKQICLKEKSILNPNILEEFSKLICILQRLKRCLAKTKIQENLDRRQSLETLIAGMATATALLQKPHNIVVARSIRRDAEFAIRRIENPIFGYFINAFKYVLYESSTPVKVLFGLALGLPIYLSFIFLPYPVIFKELLEPLYNAPNQDLLANKKISKYEVDETVALLVMVGIAGSLGSIISILTRIKEYENEKYSDAVLPVCIGALKPMIGGASGILIFTLVGSGLIPLKIDNNDPPITRWYALFAVAFVTGFSERLFKDIVSRVENTVDSTSSKFAPALTTSTLGSQSGDLSTKPESRSIDESSEIQSPELVDHIL